MANIELLNKNSYRHTGNLMLLYHQGESFEKVIRFNVLKAKVTLSTSLVLNNLVAFCVDVASFPFFCRSANLTWATNT